MADGVVEKVDLDAEDEVIGLCLRSGPPGSRGSSHKVVKFTEMSRIISLSWCFIGSDLM